MGESQTSGQNLTTEQWEDISRRLREPFDPHDVDFRVQGKVNGETGKAQVVAYIDARAVQDRLDAVVGAGNWSFDWTPLVIDNGEVMVAKGVLTVYGISKADAGSASNFEQTLGAVSHCFKRAAVHWGIGRYLYDLPMAWVPVERGGRISEAVLSQLRARLPRPAGSTGPARIESDAGERVVETPVSRQSAQGAQEAPRARPEPTIREAAPSQGPRRAVPVATSGETREQPATEQQVASIRKLCTALGKPDPESGLTYSQAKLLIVQLSADYQRARKAS
jgi:Rad52/22 family double-strand break repair protein